MAEKKLVDYKRYKKYWGNLKRFYQKPVAFMSSALIFTLFTIAFFALLAVRPTLATVGELVKKIEDQEVVEKKLAQKGAALATVQSEYLFVENRLYLLDAAIPTGHQLPRMLKEIEYIAAEHELVLSDLQLGSFSLIKPAGKEKGEDILEIDFAVSASGSYLILRAFLDDLAGLDRVMKVTGFTLTESKSKSESGVKLTVFLKAYYVPELVP